MDGLQVAEQHDQNCQTNRCFCGGYSHDEENEYLPRQILQVMRKSNEVLVRGSLKYLITDEANRILAYSRNLEKKEAIAVFNLSNKPKTVSIPALQKNSYTNGLLKDKSVKPVKGKLVVTLGPKESMVLISK